MRRKDKKQNIINNKFIKEYNRLMKSSENAFTVPVEWRKEGDTIQKYSIYEDYTPVKISIETTFDFQN